MPTNYTPSFSNLQSPSPSPAPGTVPILRLPVDGDPRNTGSIYQPLKVLGDFIAYIQAAFLIRQAFAPSGLTGYTTPIHVGTGSGSVTFVGPSGSPAQPTNALVSSVLVKIVVGGSTGAATYTVSIDNGVTFGSTATTGANVTYPDFGLKLAFSGTFVANDTYTSIPTDTPQMLFLDAWGPLPRWGVSHNGYPSLGRMVELREIWPVEVAASTTTTPLANLPTWKFKATGGGSYGTAIPSASYPAQQMTVVPGTALNDVGVIYRSAAHTHLGYVGLVLESDWDATINTSAANINFYCGFSKGSGSPAVVDPSPAGMNGHMNGIYFRKLSANANWEACVDNGTTITAIDTGITPVIGTPNTFKVEMIVSSFLGASLARFFIDGDFVGATNVSNLPASEARLFFGGYCLGAATGSLSIGPVQSYHNSNYNPPVV